MSKKIISQTTRFLTCLLLLVAVSFVSITAHAAGTENWGASNYGILQKFRVKDTNLTPVKTITKTGLLSIKYYAVPCREGHLSCPKNCTAEKEKRNFSPFTVTVQIRNAKTGRTLARCATDEYVQHTISYKVKAGMKIQIFFDVSTKAGERKPGPTRVAHIQYQYRIK